MQIELLAERNIIRAMAGKIPARQSAEQRELVLVDRTIDWGDTGRWLPGRKFVGRAGRQVSFLIGGISPRNLQTPARETTSFKTAIGRGGCARGKGATGRHPNGEQNWRYLLHSISQSPTQSPLILFGKNLTVSPGSSRGGGGFVVKSAKIGLLMAF